MSSSGGYYTLCCMFYLILGFSVVGIPLIIYYSKDPKNPTFALEDASVNGFNLTSDGRLTCYFQVVLKATNPSRKNTLVYSNLRVSILKDKQRLAVDALGDFPQRKRDVRLLRVAPVALNVNLKEGPAFDIGLESGMGYIDFNVFMGGRLSGRVLEVNCQHVVLNITAPSLHSVRSDLQVFRSIDCGVRVYSDDPN